MRADACKCVKWLARTCVQCHSLFSLPLQINYSEEFWPNKQWDVSSIAVDVGVASESGEARTGATPRLKTIMKYGMSFGTGTEVGMSSNIWSSSAEKWTVWAQIVFFTSNAKAQRGLPCTWLDKCPVHFQVFPGDIFCDKPSGSIYGKPDPFISKYIPRKHMKYTGHQVCYISWYFPTILFPRDKPLDTHIGVAKKGKHDWYIPTFIPRKDKDAQNTVYLHGYIPAIHGSARQQCLSIRHLRWPPHLALNIVCIRCITLEKTV